MKTKIVYLLITTLSWFNVVKSNEAGFVSAFKKQHVFYYYPKYKVYYCTENKKWYYPNGCTWVISKKMPQHISLFKLLFAKKEKVVSSSVIPFSHYNLGYQKPVTLVPRKVIKPNIKWHTYYQSKEPAKMKINVRYRN